MARRKRKTSRRRSSRRRMGAVGKANIQATLGIIAGAVAGRLVANKLLPNVDSRIKNAGVVVLGAAVFPRLIKGELGKAIGNGMVAAGGAYTFDDGEYPIIMESGDAHTRNAEAYTLAAGREVSRDAGKGITYGIMYGAQAQKISIMLGISMDAAQRVIDAFWDSNLGLKGRKEWLENFWEATGRKFIPSFDGRRIWTRSKHSLLNAYQQSSGACLFDLVGILFHHQNQEDGVQYGIGDQYQMYQFLLQSTSYNSS